jgi:hypothetical protein
VRDQTETVPTGSDPSLDPNNINNPSAPPTNPPFIPFPSEGERPASDYVYEASQDLYLGDGVKVNERVYHRTIKKKILSRARQEGYDYSGIVGTNPDVRIENGEVQLVASPQSPFKGASVSTNIPASDFFDY